MKEPESRLKAVGLTESTTQALRSGRASKERRADQRFLRKQDTFKENVKVSGRTRCLREGITTGKKPTTPRSEDPKKMDYS